MLMTFMCIKSLVLLFNRFLFCVNISSQGMLGHLQVFVLSDWLSDRLPVEFSETTRGLRWLIPREKLPWKRKSSSMWPNHLLPTEAKTAVDVSDFSSDSPI